MRQKPKAYLETSVISYATGRLSGQLMVAAQQQYTMEWLIAAADCFDLYVSDVVAVEATQGDSEAVTRRLTLLRQYAAIGMSDDAEALAAELVRRHSMPARARTDALHVAISAVNAMDYLVTWNCTHINNAAMKPRIERCCAELGYHCPVICTPLELQVNND